MIVSLENESKKSASKKEVDAALDKIFDKMNEALRQRANKKISLENVDETLDALFDAINRAQYEGEKIKVPDFKRIIEDEF